MKGIWAMKSKGGAGSGPGVAHRGPRHPREVGSFSPAGKTLDRGWALCSLGPAISGPGTAAIGRRVLRLAGMPRQWVTSDQRSRSEAAGGSGAARHGACFRGARPSSAMLTDPPQMKTLVGRHLRCAKCGKLLAASGEKKRTNGSSRTHGYRGIRMEYGQGKELGWVLCACGHETPLGRSKTRSHRV